MGKMNPGMKMLMMDNIRKSEQYPRSEYGGGNRRMIGYDRDMNGQATTSNYGAMPRMGGYERGTPHMGGYGYDMETESRRRRDSRGRYMMDGMYDDDEYDHPRMMNEPPHMTGSRYGFRDVYADIHTGGVANRPMGGMMGDMSAPVDEHTARKWVKDMDGGEHFKVEQSDQLRNSVCPGCERWEFYVALNAMHSDHCETMKKLGMDKPEVYAHLAKDFLEDKDAKPNKLRIYMETIAK